MQIEILRPWLLPGIPLVILLFLMLGRMLTGQKHEDQSKIKWKGVKKKSFILHCLAASSLILAASGLSIKWTGNHITTVYVVDLSDSTSFYQEQAREFVVSAVSEMPENNYAGIITFGGDTQLEQFVSNKKVFSKFETTPVASATNLEEAVSAALALFGDDTAKRIVLLSDGYENAGSIENTVSSLQANQVEVLALQIEKGDIPEVYLSDLTIPSRINVGDTFSVSVEIKSNIQTSATLYLYSGQTLKGQEQVELQKGTNHYIFSDTQTDTGLKTYRVVIDVGNDTETANNEYSAYTTIQTAPRVLVVEGQVDKGADIAEVLKAINIDYEVVTPSGVPETMNDLLEYQSVLFVDVYLDDLRSGFLNIIESYVKDYGGGFIACGGENSFALGNYQDTVLEDILPVNMDLQGEKEIPSVAMALVIDKSGSMSDGNGVVTNLDLAKQAAMKSLENLRDIDEIGVLCFDDTFTWTSELKSASERESVQEDIQGIALGGGTSIYPAVKEAYEALKDSQAPLRHILLLTDGQDGFRDYDDLMEGIIEEGITLSTVSVGTDADTVLLETLAEKGNGRYYHTDINSDIPRIFAQEVYLSVEAYLINREFTPIISSSHSILPDSFREGYPTMLGYIATTAKSNAQVILLSDEDDPILSIWQYGLGKTAAFTTDAENKWTANYAGWDAYAELWRNIIDYTVSEEESGDKYAEVSVEGSQASITYYTDEYTAATKVSAIYTFEDGTGGEIELYASAPGVYSANLPLSETGVYSLNIRQEEDGEITSSLNTAAIMQYSREYRYEEDLNVLEGFIELSGGSFITDPSQVYKTTPERVKARVGLTNLLLILGLFIFFFDVAYRRLQFKLGLQGRAKEAMARYHEKRTAKKAANKSAEDSAIEPAKISSMRNAIRVKEEGMRKVKMPAEAPEAEDSKTLQKPLPSDVKELKSESEKTETVKQRPESAQVNVSKQKKRKEKQQNILDTGSLLKKKEQREQE